MSAYDSISTGLNQALAYAQGKTAGARLHSIEIPEVDVAQIRQKTIRGAGIAGIGLCGPPEQQML